MFVAQQLSAYALFRLLMRVSMAFFALLSVSTLLTAQPAYGAALTAQHEMALDEAQQLDRSSRTLQNAASAADIVAVSTAAELRAAVADTATSHIVINDHMNLTGVGGSGGSSYVLGLIPENVKSIRVCPLASLGHFCVLFLSCNGWSVRRNTRIAA